MALLHDIEIPSELAHDMRRVGLTRHDPVMGVDVLTDKGEAVIRAHLEETERLVGLLSKATGVPERYLAKGHRLGECSPIGMPCPCGAGARGCCERRDG